MQAVSRGVSGVELRAEGPLAGAVPEGALMCGLVPEDVEAALRAEYGSGLTRTELFAAAALGGVLPRVPRRPENPDAASGVPSGTVPEGAGARRAMILSTTKGNVSLLEGAVGESEDGVPDIPEGAFLAAASKKIASLFGLENDCYTVSNACISGVSALVVAKRMIEFGKYDEVAVVGADTLNPFIVSGFASFKSLSPDLCRPYDAARCGLNLGEAAGAVLLSAFPAEGVAVISGGAVSNDANHISGPSRTGDGLYFAIRDAMDDAGVGAGDISFLNLHGTATAYNDEMESKAVALAGLSDRPAQSFKPYIGHTLGACGVVETILCIRELQCGDVWGTPGYETPGVPCALNVSATAVKTGMRHCVKTASGFGGCNAAVVLSLPDEAKDMPDRPLAGIRTVGKVVMDNADSAAKGFGGEFGEYIRAEYRALGQANLKFFKMDDMGKLAYVAAAKLLGDMEFAPEEMAVILQNSSSSLDTDIRHQRNISHGGGASPAVFVYTLPNVASGEISISRGIKGENTFFISEKYDGGFLLGYAAEVLTCTPAKYCIAGRLEYLGGEFSAVLELVEKSKDY